MSFSPLTLLGSGVWMSLTEIKKALYRWGWLRSVRLPVRVISVGNFEVGGTGKTPVVAELARDAVARGEVPVILTRGYGGRWEKLGGLMVPGKSVAVDPLDCGDEPALVHELVPEAWIGVGADRVASWGRVREQALKLGLPLPSVVILDDGLQHLRVQRDLNVVLMTSHRPWEKFFREWPRPRQRVPSCLVWSKGNRQPWRISNRELEFKLDWTCVELGQTSQFQASAPVWLVTGVAQGHAVKVSLERAGWNVQEHTVLRDHATYSREWLAARAAEARARGLVLATTGKDWVKWKSLGFERDEVRVIEPVLRWNEKERAQWLSRLWEKQS